MYVYERPNLCMYKISYLAIPRFINLNKCLFVCMCVCIFYRITISFRSSWGVWLQLFLMVWEAPASWSIRNIWKCFCLPAMCKGVSPEESFASRKTLWDTKKRTTLRELYKLAMCSGVYRFEECSSNRGFGSKISSGKLFFWDLAVSVSVVVFFLRKPSLRRSTRKVRPWIASLCALKWIAVSPALFCLYGSDPAEMSRRMESNLHSLQAYINAVFP